MARRRGRQRLLMALALVCFVGIPTATAHALPFGWSPAEICSAERSSAQAIAAGAKLMAPTEGETVEAGSSLTFSLEVGADAPLTFSIASSPSLISTLDVDTGIGSQSGTTYTFVSTKATATPRTLYWAASFTRVPTDCTGPPETFTTPVHTLTVVATQPEPTSRPRRLTCRVPTLTGLSLSAARRALRRAHCQLGKVIGSSGRSGRLVVTQQSVRPDRRRPAGTRVAVTLGRR